MSSKVSTTRPLYCGELARLSSVSPDTVRFYERRNLLLPAARTSAGYRVFSPDSLARMRLIRAALSIGFSVTELADILRDRNSGGVPCRRVRNLAADKLAILQSRIRELQSWRRELRSTLIAWDRMLAKTPRGKPARLLEALTTRRKIRLHAKGSRHSKTGRNMKLILLVAFTAVGVSAQSNPNSASQTQCPMHAAHTQMNDRGEKGMGFSQTGTTHHFFLKPNGGLIQVEANDAADAANRAQIRIHLAHIAKAFQNGDFDIPMFVHDTVPPGVPDMRRLQKNIQYSFEETPNGGRVIISSANKEALEAIHQFLRFQIQEHHTGDPIEVR